MSLLSFSSKELSQAKTLDSDHFHLPHNQAHPFDWTNRWLKGHEYAHILRNIDLYCHQFGFQKFESKSHPECIYKNPVSNQFCYFQDGHIYFVKGNGVGSEFGFPRVSEKKKYRWKKMNFTTDLPKKNPYVTYVVASAIKSSSSQNDKDLPDFRMHAVIPHGRTLTKESPSPEYILCHVREVENRAVAGEQAPKQETCFSQNKVDFYRLFLYLHNVRMAS